MSVLQIKNELLRLLTETDDPQLLEKVKAYFQNLKEESSSKGDDGLETKASKLTVKELNAQIEEAEKQEGKSYEDFRKRYKL